MKLQGRVAVVTGAGRGIGEAVALALAREGASLTLASRTQSELEGVAALAGVRAEVVRADVSCEDDVERVVRRTLDVYGRLDILVNAAGVHGPIGPVWDADTGAWRRAVEVNLLGTFLCCRYTLPAMIERRSGSIVNFSGGGATDPLPRFSAYGASKSAVVRLTETIAEEVRGLGVRVNAVAPGAVDTSLQDAVLAAGERAGELVERIRKMRETGEGAVPRELAAELVVFLVSDASAPLTGKLVAAPYDGWKTWTASELGRLAASPWLTLRRIDQATLGPLAAEIEPR